MRPIIIISAIMVLATPFARGQASLADSLLYCERLYFAAADPAHKNAILVHKMDLYIRAGNTGEAAFNEVQRVRPASLENKFLMEKYLWNGAVIAYLNNQTDVAKFLLSEYAFASGDSSVSYRLLSLLVNKYNDTLLLDSNIRQLALEDTVFNCLGCFKTVALYERKHKNFYLLSSALLPGSGTVMNGYPLKGLMSLVLTSGSVIGVVKLVQYGVYLNAFFWGTGVGLKFYTGNILLTEKLFERKEVKQKNKLAVNCELALKRVLQKYPLTLKE